MHIVIIGGTGHVGTYLVPRLVEAGHSLTVITRGQRKPYSPHGVWNSVRLILLDRAAEEKAGTFGSKIRALQPDAVIDMICFTEESARHLVDALRGQVQYFLHCSTVWVHGYTTQIPVSEDAPRRPIGDYGIRKAAIEAYLVGEARRSGFPAACILPGHIVGPGWVPLNPTGNFNPDVYARLGRGDEVALPNQGTDIVHHVHADDVAQLFVKVITHWNTALGESFHAVSPAALTLHGYAEAVAGWFGQPARLKFLPFEVWRDTVSPEDADATWGHLEHSPNCYSIAKAQRLLDYQPRYTSLEAIYESVQALVTSGVVKI
jgi:nucleoside-diphosphate-sugar epimerase